MARPSDYDPKFCQQAAKLCAQGATDKEVAEYLEVSDRTIYRWKAQYPKFCQALKTAKDIADDRVERSLYNRAVGYSFESEKVFQFQGEICRADVVEHVPPDVTAAIFWLKNRKPEQWRDVKALEHSGKLILTHEDALDALDDSQGAADSQDAPG